MNQKTKGHGFYRKNKAYGLVCGIALAGAFFFGTGVSADEVTETAAAPTTAQVATQTIVEPATGDLTSAIAQATSVSADVVQEANQTVTDQAAAQADYAAQAEAIHAAVEAKAQEISNYEAEKAAVEAENAAIAQRNAEKKAAYEQQLAEAEANKQKEGYISEVVKQDLVYATEPNAKITSVVSSNPDSSIFMGLEGATKDELNKGAVAYVEAMGEPLLNQDATTAGNPNLTFAYQTLNAGGAVINKLRKGDTVTATYENLENTYVKGTKASKAVIVYTPQRVDGDSLVSYQLFNDPTKTLRYAWNADASGNRETAQILNTARITYYDEAGNAIGLNDVNIVMSANSLNNDDNYYDSNGQLKTGYEFVSLEGSQGQFVTINGSSITVQGDEAYATQNNAYPSNGVNKDGTAKGTWDAEDLPNFWYGSIAVAYPAGVVDGTSVTMAFGAQSREEVWFTVNTFAPYSVVEVPVYETPKELPTAPEKLVVTYHLNEYNHVLTAVKDVIKDGVSIDNGTLKLGDKATYTLEGAKVLANGKDTLVKYDFEDKMDVEHDQYLGYRIYAFTPITLTDGTVINSLDDLKAFATQSYDAVTGRFYVSLNSDFLAKVSKDSDFQAKVDVDFERIKEGDVFNVFNNRLSFMDKDGNVTEVPVPSNEVVTHTPEEDPETPTPEQPKPEVPIEEAPVAQQAVVSLPQTGESVSVFSILSGIFLVILGFLGVRKKQS